MDVLHRLIGYLAVAGVAIGIGWSGLLFVTRRPGNAAFERFQAGVVAVIVVAAASGLLRLAAGPGPSDGLHVLYAVVAIGLIPLARSFFEQARGRSAVGLLLVTFSVLGAVMFRLLTTG
ncbi:MAG TPA: hypothetical protein VF494_04470 [Candidatus Limnocylindrales bacterium]